MKICVAQTRSKKGDIQSNIENHLKFIDIAVFHGVNTIIFPELSLTNYEPTLAKEFAVDIADGRLNEFQRIANSKQITIGVGIPTRQGTQACISTIFFQPDSLRQLYSKKYLHPDEEEFFISGNSTPKLSKSQKDIAFAICYELSISNHAKDAFKRGAEIYIASVAKTTHGVEKATERLSELAKKYSMTVLMSNCVGEFDNCVSGGKSSVWNNKGDLLGQLDQGHEGSLIFDTVSSELLTKTFDSPL